MSQENVEIVRRAWETWERGDLTGWLDLISDEVVTRRVGLDNATFHGKEGFLENASEWSEGFSEWSVAAKEFMDAGDRVVVRNHQSARGEASGALIEMDFWFVHTISEGKVVRVDMFVDEREALEAAGLREEAMSQENVETVARLYNECWGLGNLELVPKILHPDIVWTAIESAPDSGTRRGQVECRAHMNDWLESFDLKHAIEEARSAPDGLLVCALHGVGTEKRTGLTTDIHYGAAFRFAPDGRLVEIHEYATHQEALEAVGLRE